MLEGMYVVHDGAPMQVHRITPTSINGPHAAIHKATTYTLVPAAGGQLVVVTIPAPGAPSWLDRDQYPTLDLTPPCEDCNRPAGYGACALTGQHIGPPIPRVLTPPARDPWAAKDGPCKCREATCGECGRAANRRWTA